MGAALSGAVVEWLATGDGALVQRGDGPLERPAGLQDAPLHGEGLTRLRRVGVTGGGAPQRVDRHVGQLLDHPLEPLGHVRHGLARAAHLGSGVLCTS